MMRRVLAISLALATLLFAAPSDAHKPSDSYLSFTVKDSTVSGQWDIAFRDLEYALGLDANGDGQIRSTTRSPPMRWRGWT